ncbi:MAG TPA: hypothetical protein VNY07_08005 [Chthoniobacterales bacterium]|jgi:hypothetical protein|nr:hypothetical protein [Chthoniobacterales bacterium]
MAQFILGLMAIALAAVLGFYGTQLAREGWTKIWAPPARAEHKARPWMGVGTFAPADFRTGQIPLVLLSLKNVGPEPAFDVVATVTATVKPATEPVPERPPHAIDAAPQTVMPGSALDYRMLGQEAPLTREYADAIRDGGMSVWVVGIIDYADGSGARHSTEFCYRFDPVRQGFVAYDPARNKAT